MNCLYCQLNSGPVESKDFIRFLETPNVMLYLHRDQQLPGRLVVATRFHFEEVTEIPAEIYYFDFKSILSEYSITINNTYNLQSSIFFKRDSSVKK